MNAENKKGTQELAIWLALMAPIMLWRGFVLTRLWAWFAVPLGAPAVGIAEAIGISLLASFLVVRSPRPRGESEIARDIAFAALSPALALTIGYAVHLFT